VAGDLKESLKYQPNVPYDSATQYHRNSLLLCMAHLPCDKAWIRGVGSDQWKRILPQDVLMSVLPIMVD
jgi:hypothetical protein